MQVEPRTMSPKVLDVPLPAVGKRRVRTDAGRLNRLASRRRNHANMMVAFSIAAVLTLVRVCYALLTG